jgi:hypothetical protein
MRPLLVRSGRFACLVGGSLWLIATRADAASPETEKVRVTYRAPPECPGEETFLSDVRARIGRQWEAALGEPARAIDVSVTVTGLRSVGRIDFIDGGGRHVSRMVSGEKCADVVKGIALVTALAIEARVPDVAEAEPAAPPPSEPAPAAAQPAPASAPVQKPAALPAAAEHASAPRSSASATPVHVDLGVAGAAISDVGPGPAFGGRVVAGLGWRKGPDVRFGVEYLTAATTIAGVSVQTYALGGRLSACPFAFPLGGSARALPCAGLAAGIAHAETRASAGLAATGSGNPPYVAPFAELRFDVAFSKLFIEASAEVRFVVDPPTYGLEPPHEQLYRVPVVAAGGCLGVGLRL